MMPNLHLSITVDRGPVTYRRRSHTAMPARRRWAPVAEVSTSDRARALTAAARRLPRPEFYNERYQSAAVDRDRNGGAAKFVSDATVDGWRRTISDDADIEAALLNPVDYEP
jgi:hypothetical protein